MSNSSDILDRCSQLIDLALKAGANEAEAVHYGSDAQSVSVRLGELEDVERSENAQIGLRVFVERSTASINLTNVPAADELRELAERAVAMAKAAPEDPHAWLAEKAQLAKAPFAELDVLDSAEPDPASLREAAHAAEDAGRAIDGITNSDGATAALSRAALTLVTSKGFAGQYQATGRRIGVSLVAGEGSDKQRDYAQRVARHYTDLPSSEDVGRLAAERAVARLNPGKLASGPMPVVFDPRVGTSLVSHLIGAINGAAAARRSTFLLDKIEDTLFDSAIQIIEQPLKIRGLASRPFDGEGLPTRDRVLVENGKVFGWLTNLAAAHQLGIDPTGHASRGSAGAAGIGAANVTLEAGSATRDELISDIEEGVLVAELIGQGVNPVTGDYSRGASGYRIRNGEITTPVAEFTVAGNLLDMFAAMTPADDLETWRATNVPSLRIDGMTIAGE